VLGRGEGEQRAHVGALVAECGTEPVGTGCGPQVSQRHAGVRCVQPPRIRQVLQPQRRAAPQRVPAGHDHRQFPLGHHDGACGARLQPERVTGGGDPIDQAQIEVAGRDLGRDGVPAEDLQCHRQPGMRLADARQRRRDGPGHRQRGQPEHQLGRRRCRHPGDLGPGRIQPQENRPRVLQQAGPGLGDGHRAPAQQRRAQIGFQRGDLLRDRRLGVAEVAGRERERAEVGHGHERAQEVRIHRA
jgi:hypothetical protein